MEYKVWLFLVVSEAALPQLKAFYAWRQRALNIRDFQYGGDQLANEKQRCLFAGSTLHSLKLSPPKDCLGQEKESRRSSRLGEGSDLPSSIGKSPICYPHVPWTLWKWVMSRDHVKRVVVVTYGKHSPLCKHTRTERLFSSLFPPLYYRQRGQVLILPLLQLIQIHLIESLWGNRRKLGRKNNKDRLGFGPNQALKSNLLVFWKVGDKLTVKQALYFVWAFSYPKNQYFTLK